MVCIKGKPILPKRAHQIIFELLIFGSFGFSFGLRYVHLHNKILRFEPVELARERLDVLCKASEDSSCVL